MMSGATTLKSTAKEAVVEFGSNLTPTASLFMVNVLITPAVVATILSSPELSNVRVESGTNSASRQR